MGEKEGMQHGHEFNLCRRQKPEEQTNFNEREHSDLTNYTAIPFNE